MAKNKQNYFDQTIRQYGDDFIMCLTPDNIQRSAKKRIFREMIQGHIDYSVYGKYFQDPKFLENLLIAAWDELKVNTLLLNALTEYDYNHPGDNYTITQKGRYTRLVYVYNVLYTALNNVKYYGYNVGYLSSLSSVLYQDRNIL